MTSTTAKSLAVSVTAIALFATACAFKNDDGAAKADPAGGSKLDAQLDANRPLVKEDFKHEFIPKPKLGEYTARITWPAGRPLQVKLVIDKTVVKTFDGRTENAFDIDCVNGRVTAGLVVISPQTGTLSEPFIDLTCPTDFEVTGIVTDIQKLNSVNGRLAMTNGSSIVTGTTPLTLNVSQLIIRDSATGAPASAKIVSFNEDRSLSWPEPEKLIPPAITIRAKKASGTLVLSLNGIDGRKREPLGNIFDAALMGDRGQNGTLGSACHQGRKDPDGNRPDICRDACGIPPKQGGQGKSAKGRKGQKGPDGERGIGTSPVTLEVIDPTYFFVEAVVNPGLASEPAAGSVPKGGKGGPSGDNVNGHCSLAPEGPPGEDGEPGGNGDRAPNGACNIISFSSALAGKIKFENGNKKLPCGEEKNLLRPL